MSREEKLQINRERNRAVRGAWAKEKELVNQGMGTVDWTQDQQKELLDTKRVKGYEGQHMKSVKAYPEYASSPDNIQFLTHQEHLDAHNSGEEKSGYRSATNGFYDPSTKTMNSFGNNPPKAPETIELSTMYHVKNRELHDAAKTVRINENKEIASKTNDYRRGR